MQDSSESVPSLEAARLAVFGPSYSGSARPRSATTGKTQIPVPCCLHRHRAAAQGLTSQRMTGYKHLVDQLPLGLQL